jgi:hypothetical protein
MNKILFLGLFLFSLLSCEKEDGKIIGTASVDNNKAVLSGITVKLYTMDTDLISTTTTDDKGKFVFSDLDSGNYYIGATITVDGKTYDTGVTPQIVYVGDEISKDVSLTLTLRDS